MGDGARLPERYEWISVAGTGGMGSVHRALDRTTGASVAVKVLQVCGRIENARFKQEAEVLAELSHPGIVRHFDHGITPDGLPYIAMEWLDGETLDERLDRSCLRTPEALRVGSAVLSALAAAHSRGVIHRDIKPANIFLVNRGFDQIRVLDFGIARCRWMATRLTRDDTTVGTPLYTSPEQARGRGDVDGRADIFSLGCVLFEALAGEPPFIGDSAMEVMTRICSGRASQLSQKCPWLPSGLSALVQSMIAIDPGARPQSAAALAAELAAYAGETPEKVQMPRPASRLAGRQVTAMMLWRSRDKTSDGEYLARVERLVKNLDCVVRRFHQRGVLLTASSASVEEQTTHLACVALAVREFDPSVRVAIATGAISGADQLPKPVAERLSKMMQVQRHSTICIDEDTRQALPKRFALTGGANGFLLLSDGAEQSAPAKEQDQKDTTPTPFAHGDHPSATDA